MYVYWFWCRLIVVVLFFFVIVYFAKLYFDALATMFSCLPIKHPLNWIEREQVRGLGEKPRLSESID